MASVNWDLEDPIVQRLQFIQDNLGHMKRQPKTWFFRGVRFTGSRDSLSEKALGRTFRQSPNKIQVTKPKGEEVCRQPIV